MYVCMHAYASSQAHCTSRIITSIALARIHHSTHKQPPQGPGMEHTALPTNVARISHVKSYTKHTHTHVHTHTHTYAQTCSRGCRRFPHAYTHTHTHTHACIHTYIHDTHRRALEDAAAFLMSPSHHKNRLELQKELASAKDTVFELRHQVRDAN